MASEPFIEQALRLEVVPPETQTAEVFSRGAQRVGLIAASSLYGAALGGVFSFVYAFIGPRLRSGSAWDRSLRLALAAFGSAWLVPFFKYPSNPPAVGDPDTIGVRTALYLVMIAISLTAASLAWIGLRRLADGGVERHIRQVLVGSGYIAMIAIAFILLPANPDSISVPAKLLWSVRTMSAAGQALLWLAMGAAFGLLTIRAEKQSKGFESVVRADVST